MQPEHHPEVLIGRRYQYDHSGNLIRTEERGRDNKDYAYDPLGRITAAGDERFAFDPAHNISDSGRKVSGNRLTDYNGTGYVYDRLGNLSEKHRDNESQYYRYDADNQLIEARIENPGRPAEVWQYRYDALGRRISKETLNRKTEFIWEGSRLLQEYTERGCYTYVYTEQGSYEPLAQIFKAKGATQNEVLYYHNDQIGIPRELTDAEGNIIWSGEYSGWGRLSNPGTACLEKGVHQPFRLQNQYADGETGLHYNFFRYYDPHCGRFTQQDPIGLAGGESLYAYAPNAQMWTDWLGLSPDNNVDQYGDYIGFTKSALERKQKYQDGLKKMRACPLKAPKNDSKNWKPYFGNAKVFHCGFDGYLENVTASPDRLMNECFYDGNGNLVGQNHEFSKCGGTPDMYSGETDPIKHTFIDPGGVVEKGAPALLESIRYYFNH